jgi:putative transposase
VTTGPKPITTWRSGRDRPADGAPPAAGTISHPDYGVQSGSWAFTASAKPSGLAPSVGSADDCYDNAVIESFWCRLQVELLDRRRWRTRLELANSMFDYLEIFHNSRRRYFALGLAQAHGVGSEHQ